MILLKDIVSSVSLPPQKGVKVIKRAAILPSEAQRVKDGRGDGCVVLSLSSPCLGENSLPRDKQVHQKHLPQRHENSPRHREMNLGHSARCCDRLNSMRSVRLTE